MKKIFINGKFLCQKITGVQRYAIEIVKRLDEIEQNDIEFYLITPSSEYIVNHLDLKSIKIFEVKGKPNYYWEQVKLASFCKKQKPDDLLNLCNIAPIRFPGSCTIHDLGCIDAPNGFSWKQKLIYKLINKKNIKKYRHIYTVSNVMKSRIEDYYRIKDVIVTYNGYEHLINVKEKKPNISLPEEFYFSLGSLNPNKNFNAIIKLAIKNPNNYFIISGKSHKSFNNENLESLKNVIFTGYLGDSEIAYLYSHCKAFLFPSLYEGFGIPPLEALTCGCKVVLCNDIKVLREIYNGMCDFVDFENVDLGKYLINDKFGDFKKYSWDTTVKILYNSLRK